MRYTITLDTGTTNTRAILWDTEGRAVTSAKEPVGVRNTAIDGNTNRLSQAVHRAFETLLHTARIGYEDVDAIYASGMITSNVGLVEVPHLSAPAGEKELAAGVQSILLPEVCPLPISFIPGIKNFTGPVTLDNFEKMDIMRGEETESVSLIHRFHGGPMLLVLPGSHMKFVSVDAQGRITGCITSISGELLNSITTDTILADAVGRKFVDPESYDAKWVLLGCDTARSYGLGRACFSGRILSLFHTHDHKKIANYILGACLASDLTAVRNSGALSLDPNLRVVVAGKAPLQEAITDLLQHDGFFCQVLTYVPENDMPLSAQGALRIGQLRREMGSKKEETNA